LHNFAAERQTSSKHSRNGKCQLRVVKARQKPVSLQLAFLCYTFFFLLVPEVATGCGIRSVRAPTPVGEALFTRRLAFAKPTHKKKAPKPPNPPRKPVDARGQ